MDDDNENLLSHAPLYSQQFWVSFDIFRSDVEEYDGTYRAYPRNLILSNIAAQIFLGTVIVHEWDSMRQQEAVVVEYLG